MDTRVSNGGTEGNGSGTRRELLQASHDAHKILMLMGILGKERVYGFPASASRHNKD
jgi:hypothetical protein